MFIPKKMKSKIADTFYDKKVSVLSKQLITDEEGGVTTNALEETDSFMGNVNFSNCKKIQEEYGLDYQIDITITTGTEENIKIDELIKYDEIIYTVTDVIPNDSHKFILASKWIQQFK